MFICADVMSNWQMELSSRLMLGKGHDPADGLCIRLQECHKKEIVQ